MRLRGPCPHGSYIRHREAPEGTRPGEYVAASEFDWCDDYTEWEVTPQTDDIGQQVHYFGTPLYAATQLP